MQRKNKKNGFTLFELLFVIAVMAVMSVVVVPAYVANKKSKAVSYAKTQLTNDIRYVQDNTLNGMKFPGTAYPPKGGYGIRMQKGNSTYLIFGDRENGATLPNKAYDSANGELFENNISIGSEVKISNLQYCNGGTCWDVPGGIVDFVCVPPYGTSYLNGTQTNSVKVFLSSTGGSPTTANFEISPSGYIK